MGINPIRLKVEEKSSNATEWPVRITYSSGSEEVGHVATRSQLEDLLTELGLSENELVYGADTFHELPRD